MLEIKINIPQDARTLINLLERNGFEAYVVGGCVRDSILGKEPKDWDICTNAKPEEMQQIFSKFRVIETGLKHGTLTVVLNGEGYEITTYRVDGDYSDGRRPDSVSFTNNLEEDLSRRDFTINALAYSYKRGIMDFFGGFDDIQNKVLTAVGDPNKRFEEDALRIMRGMRFSSILGFAIEENTAKSMLSNRDKLVNVSAERKNVEFTKMLMGKGADRILREFKDIIGVVIPEVAPMFNFEQHNPYHDFDVWEHTVRTVMAAPYDVLLKLSAFFHDVGKPSSFTIGADGVGHFYGHPEVSAVMTEKIMRDLHYSNVEIETVVTLIRNHDIVFEPSKRFILRMCNKIGVDNLQKLVQLRFADVNGQKKVVPQDDSRLVKAQQTVERLASINLEEQCFTLKHLAINGNTLMQKFNMKPGQQMGEVLNTLLNSVIAGEVENTEANLLEFCVNNSLV